MGKGIYGLAPCRHTPPPRPRLTESAHGERAERVVEGVAGRGDAGHVWFSEYEVVVLHLRATSASGPLIWVVASEDDVTVYDLAPLVAVRPRLQRRYEGGVGVGVGVGGGGRDGGRDKGRSTL